MTTTPRVQEVPTKLLREASELGWAPGQSAQSVYVDDVLYRYSRTTRDGDGDVVSWHYVSMSGKLLVVLND